MIPRTRLDGGGRREDMSIGDPRVWKHRSSLAKQGKETIAVREVLDQVSQETEPRPPRSQTGFGGSKPRVVRAQEREERPGERRSSPRMAHDGAGPATAQRHSHQGP